MLIQKKYIIKSTILLAIGFLIYLFSNANIWEKFIISKINAELKSREWELKSVNISGNFFSLITFDSLVARSSKTQSLFINQGIINIGYISSLFEGLTFDILSLEELVYSQIENQESLIKEFNYKDFRLPFSIRDLFVSGKLTSEINGKNIPILGSLKGEINNSDNLKFNFSSVSLSLLNDTSKILLDTLIITTYDNQIYVDSLSGRIGLIPIEGSMSYTPHLDIFKGSLDIQEFLISKELFSKTPLKGKFSKISGNLDFKSEKGSSDGRISLKNNIGLDMNGVFKFTLSDSSYLLNQLKLEGENSNLDCSGEWTNRGNFYANLNLDSLDISRWIINQPKTNLTGKALLDGYTSSNNVLEKIELKLEVEETELYKNTRSTFDGKIVYYDSLLTTVNSVMLNIGESSLLIDGSINLKEDKLDIEADLQNADIELINEFWIKEFSSGRATGRVQIRGPIKSPSAVADLNCKNISYKELRLENLDFHTEINNDGISINGFLSSKINKGNWKEIKIDNGTMDFSFSKNKMVIESFHLKSGDDYFLVSGSWLSSEEYKIDRIQIAYQDNYLVNAKPVIISYIDSTIITDPFEIHINDGLLEGRLKIGNIREGRLKMSNFDSKVLTQFFKDQRLNISGIVFGELWFSLLNNNPIVDLDLSLKKGQYMGEEFDEMIISLLYQDNLIHIDDVSMTRAKDMGMQVSGILPIENNNSLKSRININSSFSNLSLEFIHKFIPQFFKIRGFASGELSFDGSLSNTEMDFNINIDEGLFDKVFLGSVYGKGGYNGEKLSLDELVSINKKNKITSYGSIPFDLNFNSKSFGRLLPNKEFDYHIDGVLTSLPFLSSYIDELDSVSGDIKLNLSLTGNNSEIIRNGNISINNSKIYLSLLKDPIINAKGTAIIIENMLDIKALNAAMVNNDDKKSLSFKNNVSIDGSINLSKFFLPEYQLNVNKISGGNIFFQALPIDISGSFSDLNINIIGRDTVKVDGVLEAENALVFYEFTTEDIGEVITNSDGIFIDYSINIPIKGQARFQNSQVDAILQGELSVTKSGNRFWSLGGELIIEEGAIFSYKDNFDNLQGFITFDNDGINPYIDLIASTTIENESINLRILGEAENIELVLQSSSGYSESDILELLTWGKRFEDQEMSSTGFGNQAYSFLGSILESQLEKSIKEMSAFGIMNLVDNIDIKGSAGLIDNDLEDDFEISAKRKFGSKTLFNLSYKRSFSLTNPDQTLIGVEYKLNRNLSLVGNMDDNGNLHLKYRYKYSY